MIEFNEKDRKIARSLVKDPNTVAFLEKLFAPDDGTAASVLELGSELPKNLVVLDDEKYGRLMKVIYFAREMNKGCISTLKQLGSTRERTPRPNAPR